MAVVDTDALAQFGPPPRSGSVLERRAIYDRLKCANLAAVWGTYKAYGARFIVVSGGIDSRALREQYAASLAGCQVQMCRLVAPAETVRRRLQGREDGAKLEWHLTTLAHEEARLEAASIEDFTVVNDRPATEVVREIVVRAGWTDLTDSGFTTSHRMRRQVIAEAEIIRPGPADPLLAAAARRFRDISAERAAEAAHAFTATPNTVAFVAVRDGEPLGWCWGHLLPRPDGLVAARVDDLVIAEQHRRKGLGRALLRAFMDEVTRQGAVKMSLTTGAHNAPARSLYESLGGGLATQGPTVNYWVQLDR